MSIVAPIITLGFGEDVHGGAIITQGYGSGLFTAVAEFLQLVGRSSKQHIPELLYVVKASLEAVNKDILVDPIVNTVKKLIVPSKENIIEGKATLVSTRGKHSRSKIFITANPISVKSGRRLISEDSDE